MLMLLSIVGRADALHLRNRIEAAYQEASQGRRTKLKPIELE